MEIDNSSSSTPTLDSSSGLTRQRFTIELRPGETTIVSWKRLIKDAHKADLPLTQETKKVQVALVRFSMNPLWSNLLFGCSFQLRFFEDL